MVPATARGTVRVVGAADPAGMSPGSTSMEREPTLSEMLDDPLVRLVMARDGVRPDEVRTLIAATAARLAARSAAAHTPADTAAPAASGLAA